MLPLPTVTAVASLVLCPVLSFSQMGKHSLHLFTSNPVPNRLIYLLHRPSPAQLTPRSLVIDILNHI